MSDSPFDGQKRPKCVVLFKNPSEPLETDPYHLTLRPSYSVHFVPILAETFHLDQLVEVIQGGLQWEGVIITSRRGAEAWVQAAQRVGISGHVDWSSTPLWSVGSASVDSLNAAQREGRLDTTLCPDISSTRIAKSAKELIPLLLDSAGQSDRLDPSTTGYCSSVESHDSTYGTCLIVRGDKSMEEIPSALRSAERQATEITVYSTSARDDIRQNINTTLLAIKDSSVNWLAFFSPSSAGFAMKHLPTSLLHAESTRIFAIGETTKAYLEEKGLIVHAVASQPTAQGMLDAIIKASRQEINR